MSDWGTDAVSPVFLMQDLDELTAAPVPQEASAALAPAEAKALQTAIAALAAAEARVIAAADAVADAEGAVRVAIAKAEAYADDPAKTWQVTAAREAVAKAERAVTRSVAVRDECGAAVQVAAHDLEGARRTFDEAVRSALLPAASEQEAAPALYYGSVDEFVREYLRNVYRRAISGTGQGRMWAADWWRYEEAVIRLEALWRAWEHLRQDPATGMSVWWRDHADHHMGVLLSPDGPFAGVTDGPHRNEVGQPLPYAPPPEGLFPDVRTQSTDDP